MKEFFKIPAGASPVTRLFSTALLFAALGSGNLVAQTFTESMGSVVSTTAISTHETNNGFDNDGFTMTGTGDVRITDASSGYTGASGAGNIFFTSTASRTFEISGINSGIIAGPTLSFGIHKNRTASNGSEFIVEVSSDGVNYTQLSYTALPTGSGTATWHLRTASGSIPQAANLRIRFTNTNTDVTMDSTTAYRVDDVTLTCSATITPDGATTLCSGGSVNLAANTASGASFLWSTGATTQSISVNASGTFTVQVTDGSSCVSNSGPVRVLVYPSPVVSVSVDDDTICPGDSVTFTARTLAADLIISEYVEGSGNEKYIEIYNGTGSSVALADYRYQAYHNGSNSPFVSQVLSGTLADGAVLVLNHGSATLYTGGTAVFGLQHDGNDAVALFKISTGSFVDIVGVIGEDPGTAWTGSGSYSTQNKTLRRKTNVSSGITVNPALPGASGFTTLTTEWDLFNQDDVSGLGAHTMNGAYSWSPATVPATGSPVKAAPSATTTYTVTGTYINGCTDDATIQVVVQDCGGRMAAPANNAQLSISAGAYPNPFGGSVNIVVSTPAANEAQIVVKDMTGRVVDVLHNGMLAEGKHFISWTPSAETGNGVYFCEVTINGERQTLQLMYQGQ